MRRICRRCGALALIVAAVVVRPDGGSRADDTKKPDPGPLAPAAALATFKAPDDLTIETALAEPDVRQPLQITFDERGRMWVVQYLQYPYPAGLKMVSKDTFWRAVYDKVPPAPPNHFRGADKITIHEDTDGDGRFDRQKTFLEGTNITTSIARGRGGVWVLNPPYLLFYPDRNNDDVPDGDPEVHLEGFGLEDTHSVVNSLCWGPDGWLYAAQGSTVSGHVVRPGLDKQPVHSMGQAIWRYHPETRRYEIFSEGGGNAFGVEFDSKGRVYSGHNGGDTRGFAYVQGGYFQKGFGKHGPLSNPYAFGYFAAMAHPKVPRFTHQFIIYEGTGLPPAYRGRLFGVAPLLSHVVMSDVFADRSSFQTKDVGYAATSSDTRFRPVFVAAAPDGAVYVSDFYEPQISHRQHFDGQIDKTTGRIYRIRAKDARLATPFDLSKRSTRELVDTLRHEDKWYRQTALRLIGDRKDKSVVPELEKLVLENTGQFALECLWALNLCGGFNESIAARTLNHSDPYVRLWTIRLLGDERRVGPALASELTALAQGEQHVHVRGQLASTARRLPASAGLPVVRQLLAHNEDSADIHLPLLEWWAIESKCESDRAAVESMFEDSTLWNQPMVQQHILERLMRRYAAAGSQKDLATCARLLRLAPGPEQARKLMAGFETAFAGRAMANLPDELIDAMSRYGGTSVVLGLRQGRADAVEKALQLVADDKADKTQQLQYVQIFGEVKQPRCVPLLLRIVGQSSDDALRGAALAALQRYDEPSIATAVLAAYGKFTDDVRAAANALLASRPVWALELLRAIDSGRIDRRLVPVEVAQRMQFHRDERVKQLVQKHWGELKSPTSAELQAEIQKVAATVRNGSGNPAEGKKQFMNTCGKCHRLFDAGGSVGPDLTSYKRDDVEYMLQNIVNPSAEIREGFENYLVATADGRTLNGFLVDQNQRLVILRGVDGQDIPIPREEIEELQPTKKSLMPDGLLREMNEQQMRDLFAYLRSSQPLNQ